MVVESCFHVSIRFYEELNDLLPEKQRKVWIDCRISRRSVKDLIESFNIPHTEVDLITVDGESVPFSFVLSAPAKICVYPVFERFDIAELTKLRDVPLRRPRFILDVHLGKLARKLRMLGFDALYERYYDDAEIVERARADHRIILTCDRGLLKRSAVFHGMLIRSRNAFDQAREVVSALDLYGSALPFGVCTVCNGAIERVDVTSEFPQEIPPLARSCCSEFFRCNRCGRYYWNGTHYEKMKKEIESILAK